MQKPALIGASASAAALVTGFILYKIISKKNTEQEPKIDEVQTSFEQEISKNVGSDFKQKITNFEQEISKNVGSDFKQKITKELDQSLEDKDYDTENSSQNKQIIVLKRPKSRLILKQSPEFLVIVVVVTSKCREYENFLEDLALRVTMATWCLCIKCSQNNQDSLRLWEQQGWRKEMYEIGSSSDLDQLHGLMIKEGYTEFLLKNSERLSVAMAIGPMDCREIQNRFTDLGFELEEEGLTK